MIVLWRYHNRRISHLKMRYPCFKDNVRADYYSCLRGSVAEILRNAEKIRVPGNYVAEYTNNMVDLIEHSFPRNIRTAFVDLLHL